MKCMNHPLAESEQTCSACSKPLCSVCIYKVKGKPFCQECIVQGAEWAPLIKGGRLSSSAPKWAAFWALIPGIGAVFNCEYLKAVAYFSIFAWLVVMADAANGIFGFAAAVFLVFTMFDSYRTAQEKARRRLELGMNAEICESDDKSTILWGCLLIVLGVLLLLVKTVPEAFINLLWPLVFVLLGAFFIYRALQQKEGKITPASMDPGSRKEDV